MNFLELRSRMMVVREPYIEFADPEVERICVETWGDGIGLTHSRAKRVTSIGSVFNGNTAITSFDELEYFTNVSVISNSAFTNCTSLTSIVFPTGLTMIGSGCCAGCTALTSVTCNSSNQITVLEAGFSGCTSLNNVRFPNSAGLILWRYAFKGTAITSIDFKIASIAGYQAFQYCTQLQTVNLSSSTMTTTFDPDAAANGTFIGCNNLKTVILPETCKTIGAGAFSGCSSLENVICLNTGQTALWRSSFESCTSLKEITIKIGSFGGYRAFYGCSSLTSLDFSDSTFTTTYNANDHRNGTFYNCTSLTSITLPSTCIIIGRGSFEGCSKLAQINSDNVTTISNYAFYSCTGLTSMNFTSLTTVAAWAFYKHKLTSIIAPNIRTTDGTSSANSGSFASGTSLTYVDFGSGCTTIGQRTFQNCNKLATLICRAETPPSLGSSALASTPSTQKIYVPYSSDHSISDAYKAATGWSSFASRIYELDANGNIPS